MSGSKSTNVKHFSAGNQKPKIVVEINIPRYQPKYEDEEISNDEEDDEGEDNDTDDDVVDNNDDDDYFYYEEEEEEEEKRGSGSRKGKEVERNTRGGKNGERRRKRGKANWEEQEEQEQEEQEDSSTPSQQIPNFEVLGRRRMRMAQVKLDDIEDITPAGIFTQFFDKAMLKIIVVNTNAYALSKDAGKGRPWTNLVIKELLIFLAILIYMGLYPSNGIEELWNQDPTGPIHQIAKEMTLIRFQQIKRYLHISKSQDNNSLYYSKVEPLLSHIRQTSKKLYIPSMNVSVDEMMVRFSGRSIHTIRIRGKPTPEGYKILALCDHGYTYTFLPASRVHQSEEVARVDGITYTGSVVLHLALQLPYKRNLFNVFMDNYFSSIPLFAWLRKNNIGACGTIRTASRGFPIELKVPKRVKLEWNFQSGKVVGEDKDVLAALWMDNGPVTMLTTIHSLGEDWQITKNRRRPRQTGLNAGHVEEIFGEDGQRELKIPCMIDDYNHHMGGVDIADQLRSYNSTQLVARRNWMPLFFWLLDITLVNSFILAKLKNQAKFKKQAKSQVEFRKKLLWELITMAKEEDEVSIPAQPLTKKVRITKKSTADDLPATRLKVGDHHPLYNSQRKTCIWCNWQAKENEDLEDKDIPRSFTSCTLCNVYLCYGKSRNCFRSFHNLDK